MLKFIYINWWLDLGLALRSLGFIVTNKEIKDLRRKLDPDQSGTIDRNDFLCAIADVYNKEDNED